MGMVIKVSPVQPKNAPLPMVVTPLLISTEVMELCTLSHGAVLKSAIAPLPLMVSTPLAKVAVTSVAVGLPMSHFISALALAAPSRQAVSSENFFVLIIVWF